MSAKYTIPITKEMAAATSTLRVSPRHANAICRAINRKTWAAAKAKVGELAEQKRPLTGRWRGKYYSKAAGQIAKLLDCVAANARQQTLEPEAMQLFISAHRGPTMWRGRRKRRFGMRMKVVRVQAVLKPVPKRQVIA